MSQSLQVVIIKPSKYLADGFVERFRSGFMPNSTVPYMRSMVPIAVDGTPVETHTVDEYVHTDLQYLKLLSRPQGTRTLVALVGVQSHQFHRALDLAAYAQSNGCMTVIGGPHVMTCDTSMFHGRGVSFALAEAELVWPRDPARRRVRRVAARVRPRPTVAAGTRCAGARSSYAERPAPLCHPHVGSLPGSRVSVPLQFLFGHQDRWATNSQPENRHHAGQPSRRQGRRSPNHHVHFRQLQ